MSRKVLSLFSLVALMAALFLTRGISADVLRDSSKQAKSEAETVCQRLPNIKKLPFKDEPIDDENYNKIVSEGKAVVPCLIDRITDLSPMKDPRSTPTYPNFRVGDLAFFLLIRITGTPFEQMLPASVTGRMKDEGVYAYFKYVQRPSNRRALQNKWQTWLKTQGR